MDQLDVAAAIHLAELIIKLEADEDDAEVNMARVLLLFKDRLDDLRY